MKSIEIEKVTFPNNKGKVIKGNLYRSAKSRRAGVIFSHGLFSSKDGYKITRMAESIAAEGYDLLAFDFSFAGGPDADVSGLSVLQEVEDLRSASGFFTAHGVEKIHFFGSSMGAAVSLLYLSERPREALSFAGIATPADLRGLITGNTEIKDPDSLRHGGFTELQGIRIHNTFFLEINGINMDDALAKISVPVLAIHGERDEIVPLYNVDIIAKRIPSVEKFIIAGGDHNLVRDTDITRIRDRLISWFSLYDEM